MAGTKKEINKLRIHREDEVEVIAGNDKGARGRVLRTEPKTRRVVVETVNIRKKHQAPQQQNAAGGIIQFEAPVAISNVMLVCPQCSEKTRAGIRREGGFPIRVCKKCGEDID